ncbi:MAG: alpha-galactosidase [Lachnospiraceae bacterium]|nr:alpha-galactosidase [Lachnospiraceae bacterium]
MAVRVEGQTFYLETKNTLYQMKADHYGVLKHLWYGVKTGQDMEYLLDYPDVGFSGNIYDADRDRAYSQDTMPLEYATEGVGDFRIPAVGVHYENGASALDLRYEGYRIEDGKYAIPGLPAVYAEEYEAQTLEITLKDVVSDVRVVLKYGVLPDFDVITRSAVIVNDGSQTVMVNKAHSLCLDIPYGKWEWVHFHGRHLKERTPERRPLLHGVQQSSSKRGISSHHQNPTVLLCKEGCTETSGTCIGAVLMYSGCFQTQIEYDQLNQTRLVMGINTHMFCWELNPGERFYTPEAILSLSATGFETLSHQFHRVIREHVCRGKYKLTERPVLINNWEATYFDFNEEKLVEIAGGAAELGVDMLVMDDGWFGQRDNDDAGLGDWYVNRDKLPGGLESLVAKVNDLGMDFGIWFEPEMISENSDLYRAHPEWVVRIPGRKPVRGRYQLVLDMSRPDVWDYLFDVMSRILNCANIRYVKWDFNRSVSDWYSELLPSGRQKEMPHRFVLGLYDLLERLTQAFPDVLFEGCCGGGGRFDAGVLYYCPQIWCSDDTDAFERTQIQYGTSFFYPISTMGSHVSAVPNHQTGRTTSIKARGVTAMAGTFGYELDLNKLLPEEKEEVKKQIGLFKEYGPLIHNGKYYRLSNPFEDQYAVWEYVSSDAKKVLVQGMIFRTEPNMLRYPIYLRGLDPEKKYRLREDGIIYSGNALMNGGILIPKAWGDYVPVEMYLEAIDG